jgi:hypothetical protein
MEKNISSLFKSTLAKINQILTKLKAEFLNISYFKIRRLDYILGITKALWIAKTLLFATKSPRRTSCGGPSSTESMTTFRPLGHSNKCTGEDGV